MELARTTVNDTLAGEQFDDSGHFADIYLTGDGNIMKVCPRAYPDEVDDTLALLDDASIAHPETVHDTYDLHRHGYDRETVVVLQDWAAPPQQYVQDHGFDAYLDALYGTMRTAAEHGLTLDCKPPNFGVIDDELVYVDVQDRGSARADVDRPLMAMTDQFQDYTAEHEPGLAAQLPPVW